VKQDFLNPKQQLEVLRQSYQLEAALLDWRRYPSMIRWYQRGRSVGPDEEMRRRRVVVASHNAEVRKYRVALTAAMLEIPPQDVLPEAVP